MDLIPFDKDEAIRRAKERLTPEEQKEFLHLLSQYDFVKSRQEMETDLTMFIREAWPIIEPGRPMLWNWHLTDICFYMQMFATRKIKRLILNVPPRSMKSLIVGVFYPAWVWTFQPWHQFLALGNEESLAHRDAVKMRRIVMSEWYMKRWGRTAGLQSGQNEKGYFQNLTGGHRVSQGLTGNLTGKGGDTIIIDDPHDAEKAQSDIERMNVLERYDTKVYTRQNDPNDSGIILIMQRLHQADLTGHMLKAESEKVYHYVAPMRFEGGKKVGKLKTSDPRKEKGELLWPERFSEKTVKTLEERLGSYGFSGQYQQAPSPAGGGILKENWWQPWTGAMPKCIHIFQSYDCAFSEEGLETNSRSARTTWGVFWHEQKSRFCTILVEAWADWVEYPDLRKQAKQSYNYHGPDLVLIEKKASGISLVQDLKRAQLPIATYNPDRDKVARAYAVQPMFEAGLVYVPARNDLRPKKWAKDCIDECASFPKGEHNDYPDTVTQALLYMRQRWLLPHPDDDVEEFTPVSLTEEEEEDRASYQRAGGGGAYG